MMSIPALQKADTELKMEIQIPLAPKSWTNTGRYNSAPMSSIINVPMSTFFTKLARPANEERLKASLIRRLSFSPIFRFKAIIKPAVTVMMPSPPTWMSSKMTA